MKMKVYIVTAGQYSGYHIECVFSSKEKADKYIADSKRAEKAHYRYCLSSMSSAEYELDALETAEDYMEYDCVIALDDGRLLEEASWPVFKVKQSDWEVLESRIHSVSAKSAAHARKLAVEGRQAELRRRAADEIARRRK